ncbi:MAG: hypothetical protein HY912_21270 [Desulfomonile tiedjei]|uniref:Uncharacterized protein n=1 Tax=Desulfomonile tiedjei TaxID=2358 RepID=A0A9D6V7A5_9BACT|nr:hypothetical protein [Desulfomonile tiedjei]
MRANPHLPDGKQFAFTIFDDPDLTSSRKIRDLYAFLWDCGFKTTKSVWTVPGNDAPEKHWGGETCGDKEYRRWLLCLQEAGFEIAYHNATYHSSTRAQTAAALEAFRCIFGSYPLSMANHFACKEGIYWGESRFEGVNRALYNLVTKRKRADYFEGHIQGSKYFWGDLCQQKIKYVRNFVFSDVNTLRACPIMPYHDPRKPYVNYWFAAANGDDVIAFKRCIQESNQDRLEREGGICILYTHFAKGFSEKGAIDSQFKALMKRLAAKNGWFVPVATLLDHLLKLNGHREITNFERANLTQKWFLDRARRELVNKGTIAQLWHLGNDAGEGLQHAQVSCWGKKGDERISGTRERMDHSEQGGRIIQESTVYRHFISESMPTRALDDIKEHS